MLLEGTQGVQPFSMEDIKTLTKSIVAFITYDNLMTQAADGGKRPHLSWNEINNEAPVSGAKMTKDYRDKVTSFTKGIVDGIGVTEVEFGTEKLKTEEIIGVGRSGQTVEALGKKKREALFADASMEKLTRTIEGKLTSSFKTNPKQLLSWLSGFADTFHPEVEEFNFANVNSIASTWGK
jgi:hypothetical protein